MKLPASDGRSAARSTPAVAPQGRTTTTLLIVPSSEALTFQPCYHDRALECARLKLPLDYWNGTHRSRSVGLAVLRVPAKVPVTDPRYAGSILVNPGGPGGSGVAFALRAAREIQNIVDFPLGSHPNLDANQSAKYFDIVGFDPRGIGFTTPGAHCWHSESARESWKLRMDAQGTPESSDAAAGRLFSMTKAHGESCASTLQGDHDIKHFVSTASVARDMLQLTEALGKWRENQARMELQFQAAAQGQGRVAPRAPVVPERLLYKPGKEKLLYWGFSYGTFLGSTFISMFPDRVGRVILDGVVWAPDYYKTLWTGNVRDTEKVMQSFYDNCAATESCPMATKGDTAASLKEKVEALIQGLYHNPLPIPGPVPEVITYSDLRYTIFRSLYTPLESFPQLARILKALQNRDGSAFKPILQPKHEFSCGLPNATTAPVDGEASMAIACGDGDSQNSLNLTDFDEHWKRLWAVSPTIGPQWALIRLQCFGWPIRPKFRFRGPFAANTSHPVLWIGNTADPVTPLWGAHKMASSFPSSVVLTQESPGHCSIASFSPCTSRAISNYFGTGVLPAPGTVCPNGKLPFDAPLPPAGLKMMEEFEAAGTGDVWTMETNRRLREAQRVVGDALTENLWAAMGQSLSFGGGMHAVAKVMGGLRDQEERG